MRSVAEIRAELDAAKQTARTERLEAARQRRERDLAERDRHAAKMAETYLSGVGKDLTDLVYQKAWDDGHAEGFDNVEVHYGELADLVTAAFIAGRNS